MFEISKVTKGERHGSQVTQVHDQRHPIEDPAHTLQLRVDHALFFDAAAVAGVAAL